MPDALPVPASAAEWALFLDVDGTLLELAGHPDSVVVPRGLVALLGRLRHALGGALALVSGRNLASVDALLGEANLDAAGCHGAELRIGGRAQVAAAADLQLSRVAERLTGLAGALPMTMVELKTHSLAFHYRAAVLEPARARDLARAALAGDAARFRLIEGKQVVEILPCDAGKGKGIAYFMARSPYAGRVPVFVGDDMTDEEGFREVNRGGGISIGVGIIGATDARFRLATVGDVAAWLAGPVCTAVGCGNE